MLDSVLLLLLLLLFLWLWCEKGGAEGGEVMAAKRLCGSVVVGDLTKAG